VEDLDKQKPKKNGEERRDEKFNLSWHTKSPKQSGKAMAMEHNNIAAYVLAEDDRNDIPGHYHSELISLTTFD
jgi:hypothetical protein